jgi:hypothetical protein
VSSDLLAGLGAFLSGVGSVLSAVWFVRRMRRRLEQECLDRLQAFKDGLHERDQL